MKHPPIIIDGYYKHYKGGIYKVITGAVDEKTGENMVVYQSKCDQKKVFVRPAVEFFELVDGFPRFRMWGLDSLQRNEWPIEKRFKQTVDEIRHCADTISHYSKIFKEYLENISKEDLKRFEEAREVVGMAYKEVAALAGDQDIQAKYRPISGEEGFKNEPQEKTL